MKKIFIASSVVAVLALSLVGSVVFATNSWGGYHWARTSNPFTLKVGDNVSSSWDSILATTSSDWSQSTVLDTTIVPGGTNATKGRLTPKNCVPTIGRVEVCNASYGSTGWLGIAQIWVSGLHITQGTVKLNDTYFNTPTYNTTAWKNLVSCQEVGHTLGLDHQDTNFNNINLGTCMDYTNDPTGTLGTNGTLDNEYPNTHDYDELAIIYGHLDSSTTIFSSTNGGSKPDTVGQNVDLNDPSAWGMTVSQDAQGKNSLYEKDLGNGEKLFTFVTWTK